MFDYFALLDEPRRPWLDPELLKTKFLALSSKVHPDRVHHADEAERAAANSHYTEVNAAYNCLSELKDRLLHLLELERGVRPAALKNVPSETMDLFAEVAQLCREVDAFLTERNRTTSPMLKVQLFERGAEWTEKLKTVQQKLKMRHDELTQELKLMNRSWGSPQNPKPLDRLEELYRHFSFLARWTEQLQERIVQLSI